MRRARWYAIAMARILASLVMLSGCASLPAFRSPANGQPSGQQTYPLEVEYELLGTATAKACGETYGSSSDPLAIGGALYDKAKYAAIQHTDGADGLVAIRAALLLEGEQKCVTVTGRAYRLLSMRATAGHGAGERSTAPPRKAEQEWEPVVDQEAIAPKPQPPAAPKPQPPSKPQPPEPSDRTLVKPF
jgi:hypothetical protein